MVPIGQQRAVNRYRPWPVLAVYSEAGAELQIYIQDVHQDSKTIHRFRPMAKGKEDMTRRKIRCYQSIFKLRPLIPT
jgi:hypothetical protein